MEALADASMTVRVESAAALARHGHTAAAIPALSSALSSENLAVVQHAARTIELLGQNAAAATAAMRQCDQRMRSIRPADTPLTDTDPVKDQAMFILFSTETFLRAVTP